MSNIACIINTQLIFIIFLYRAVADCDHQILVFKDFSMNLLKEVKLSPNCFVQIAIQLAYYK